MRCLRVSSNFEADGGGRFRGGTGHRCLHTTISAAAIVCPKRTPTCPIARQVWPNSQKWRSLQISHLGRQASRIVVEADRHRGENLSHLVASDPADGSEQHLQTGLDVAVSSPPTAWNQIAHELPNANRRLPKSDTLW